jgi:anti-sigma regulatory factor (Ser/Thr protein kinase)
MARTALHRLTSWITAAAVDHPEALVDALAAHLGCTRRTAAAWLRRLVASGWLTAERRGRATRYRPGTMREVVRTYALEGLSEDVPWRCDFAPYLDLPPPLLQMLRHAFTELVNNAVDHSGGTQVVVSLRQTATQAQLLVSDDGCGLFERLQGQFGIETPEAAVLELAKGRLTTDPARHTGRGLFYTLRLADVAMVHANARAYQRRQWEGSRWRTGRPLERAGTSVYLAIALDTDRRLADVLRTASIDGAGLGLQRVRLPLRLVAHGGALVSRAEARRVLARLGGLERVDLDFEGVDEVGHSFADELFRVGAPGLERTWLMPVGMSTAVAATVGDILPVAA